jgi:hypothetical protein
LTRVGARRDHGTMSDDRIIDLTVRLRARESDEGTGHPLSLRGTDGERRRYALPLWRMAHVAQARWAALVCEELRHEPTAVVVIDLAEDPPRAAPEDGIPRLEPDAAPPAILTCEGGGLVLPLGAGSDGMRWYAVTADRESAELPLAARRDDLLFLAGECAGLLELVETGDFSPSRPSDA